MVEEAARLGFETTVAPTDSFGSLDTNARIICDWLNQPLKKPVILVSLSKGTAELKSSLRNAHGQDSLAHVSCWVSLSGIWWGSPLVGWLLERRLRCLLVRLLLRWRGHRFRVVEQLNYGANGSLSFDVRIPEQLRVVHVVGFPLVRHLSSPLARRGHRRLAPLGPNDAAGILLADVGRLPGTVLPIWGADPSVCSPTQSGIFMRCRRSGHIANPGNEVGFTYGSDSWHRCDPSIPTPIESG